MGAREAEVPVPSKGFGRREGDVAVVDSSEAK